MNLLDWINQGIDTLTKTCEPGIDALGFHIFIASADNHDGLVRRAGGARLRARRSGVQLGEVR